MLGLSDRDTTSFEKRIADETGSKIRTFLYELAEGTSNYKSLHNLTEQVEHQYHGRFLIELLQNAHDALLEKSAENQQSRIEIVLDQNDGQHGALYIANDGNPFSESNFKSLSQLGQSDKDPQESIGNKGIGFRSILEITTSPVIYSRSAPNSSAFDGYCFSFCPSVIEKYKQPIVQLFDGDDEALSPLASDAPLVDWGPETLEKFRRSIGGKGSAWIADELKYLSPYLLPFPVSASPHNAAIHDFQERGFATALRLPFKNDNSRELAKTKLEGLDANTVLFLNRVGSLVVDSGSERRVLTRKNLRALPGVHDGHEIEILDSAEPQPRSYWIWNKLIKVSDSPAEFRSALLELPGKWPELNEATISLAVHLGEEPEKGMFSIFLPTNLPTGCAAHISAPFFGDMSRTDIDFENAYNRHLLYAAAFEAMEIALSDLGGRGLHEAWAIADLLSPWPEEKLAGKRWFDKLETVADSLGINLSEHEIAFTDKGWNSFSRASLIPSLPSANLLTDELLRKHARFPAFASEMCKREFLIKSFFDALGVGPDPFVAQVADTVESVAKELHGRGGGKSEWNAFWTDAIDLFSDDSAHLRGKEVLLGADNALHACGGDCAVFFTPRQGSLDDEEGLSEGAIREIPDALKSYVAFLHADIQVYDEKGVRTPVRRFLETTLVQTFRVEDILTSVLIHRTPSLPIARTASQDMLCRDILLWGLNLVSNLADRGKGGKTLRLLKSLPVPCRGGWFELRSASFGPGWHGTRGELTHKYLKGVSSAECKEAAKRLLVGPKNERWGPSGGKFQKLLSDAGVFDGLRLSTVDRKAWASMFCAWPGHFRLPDGCPSGIPKTLWKDYVSYIDNNIELSYSGSFYYEMQEFNVIPGFEKYSEFDVSTRESFMHIVLHSIAKWEQPWSEVVFKKVDGQPDRPSLLSPAFYALKQLPWLGTYNIGGSMDWSRVSERWYVPCARLSGKPRLFAHLKPLPGPLAQLLDGDSRLAEELSRLGMPKFDTESKSESTRLLNDLARALDGDITELNVFLGQVRDAWSAFEPEEETEFPSKIVIRRGNNLIEAHMPSVEPVYLPDSSASFMDALRQFAFPVIAIDTTDAKRLAIDFKNYYGDGVQLASDLKMEPLVGGEPWNEEKHGFLADSELEWVIPMILSLVAFTSTQATQAKGTNSDPFQKRVQMFREARLCWVPRLEAGVFKGDEIIVKPKVPALWLDKEKVLLVTEETREQPHLLSEALAVLIQRDDLVLQIKLALKEIDNCEPDTEDIKQALLELKISEDQYLEAREHWRGDLGPVIIMIRPLVMLLDPKADVGRFVELETEEAVLDFLNSSSLQGFDASDILAKAHASRNMAALGKSIWKIHGDEAQLVYWNTALEQFGEPPIRNSNAVSEMKSHIVAASQPLNSLITKILRTSPEAGQFRLLANKLIETECPDALECNYWEVSFNLAIQEVVPVFESLGATPNQLEAIRLSTSPENLLDRISMTGVDTSFDPHQVAKANRENLKKALQLFQRVGLAWCLQQENADTAPWEAGADQLVDEYSDAIEKDGYLSVWSNEEIFGLLKHLPREGFWQKVNVATSLSELFDDLSLTPQDLEEAQSRLDDFKEQLLRKKRLISICGDEFDGSEDNLSNLWSHICGGITDETLDEFAAINLNSRPKLNPVGDRKNKKPKKERGETKSPSGRLSKSMENAIGASGEIHAFRLLQKSYGASVVHPGTWVSGNGRLFFPDNEGDDSRGCDFEILHEGKKYHIEVKASQGEDESFKLGSSEIRLAMALAKKRNRAGVFQVLHVTNALSKTPSFGLLPNPYDQKYQSYFVVEDADARVRYKRT